MAAAPVVPGVTELLKVWRPPASRSCALVDKGYWFFLLCCFESSVLRVGVDCGEFSGVVGGRVIRASLSLFPLSVPAAR
jgi:hypothetical protein